MSAWHGYRVRLQTGVLVTVRLLTRDRRFRWTRIYGVQCGPWFIGAIRGTEVEGGEA